MVDIITSIAFKKILMLNYLEEDKNIDHDLFPNHSIFRYLICGPKKCGRTSLLFELAFQFAENEKNVLFISNKKLESLPCLFNCRSQPPSHSLKRIKIFYTPTPNELMKLLAEIHLEDLIYDLLLIDNFDEIYSFNVKEPLSIATKLLAFLFDAVDYFRRNGARTFLIVSIASGCNKFVEVFERQLYNRVEYYPHHSGNGYAIKSSSCLDRDNDNVIGIHSYFKEGQIWLDL